jgi:hypothetical protein
MSSPVVESETSGNWTKWRGIWSKKVHVDSIIKLQNLKKGAELYEFLPKHKKIENWGKRLQSARN